MRLLDGITDSIHMNLGKLWKIVRDREAWHAAVHGIRKSQKGLSNEQQHIYIHTHTYKVTNRDLLYSTGNSTQYFVMTYMGKESKKRVGTRVTDSLWCTPQTNTAL